MDRLLVDVAADGQVAVSQWLDLLPESVGHTLLDHLSEAAPDRPGSSAHTAAIETTWLEREDAASVAGEEQVALLVVESEPLKLGERLGRGEHRVVGGEQHLPSAPALHVLDEFGRIAVGGVGTGVDVNVGCLSATAIISVVHG